jgi:hypothetical protein
MMRTSKKVEFKFDEGNRVDNNINPILSSTPMAWQVVEKRLRAAIAHKDDAINSYAEFYQRAASFAGLPDDFNPCSEADDLILRKIAEHDEIEKLRADLERVTAGSYSKELGRLSAVNTELRAELSHWENGEEYARMKSVAQRDGLQALAQYERAQKAEDANAKLRADLVEMRIKIDQLREALRIMRRYFLRDDTLERTWPDGPNDRIKEIFVLVEAALKETGEE